MTNAPELSVVIPSVNGLSDVAGCLDALRRMRDVRTEVVVVDRTGASMRAMVRRDYPEAVLVEVPADTTIPAMRARGFEAARADAIGVIEDHVIVPPDWGHKMLDALAEGADVVGGCIDNAATEKYVDWAAFLCEYSACIPPLPAGEATWLPGNNIVYRKALLERFRAVIAEGKWENHLHDAMRAAGVKLICRPDIVVGHKMHYTFGLYLSQRYLYARSYAGARLAGAPVTRRVAYGAAAFALPPLLFVRTVRSVLAKGRYRDHLVRSLPLLGVFVTSWAAGEIVGYWFGGGTALSKVR